MNRATSKMRDFAESLIIHELKGNKLSAAKSPAAVLVTDKLRSHLAILIGNSGFHSLLSRALTLASAESARLLAVSVKLDGSLEGMDGLEAQHGRESVADDSVVIVAHLVGLMVAFIGEGLTLQIIREVWPKLSLNDRNAGRDTKNEKTK